MTLNRIYFAVLIIWISACGSSKSEIPITSEPIVKKKIEHFNIIFAPDLSNRVISEIRPKPVEDTQIILDFIRNVERVLTYKRNQNQYDIYSFDFINKNLISRFNVDLDAMRLDFSIFDNRQIERIDYLRNRSSIKTFDSDLQRFESELKKVYTSAEKDNYGADIYSYLNSLSQSNLGKDLNEFEYQNVVYQGVYRNILIIFTDGYIEAGLYGDEGCKDGNQCYYLSSNKISEFRKAYKDSGEISIENFFLKNNYGIVPVNNPVLTEFEVLVLEINDRSLDVAGNATVHPKDYEIIKLFWSDWLQKSGVKKFDILPISSSKDLAQKNILEFLGIK
ncbi:hypothetical protein [Algoriphagus limi]|uniref:Uncharacterized protein n=1 Tax=Algoriphagus limi TaxID=2975273 RepID=A0ABT2G0R7_9BACT|nr:hypothetical protein [Algoriphagus limi]MCS5488863.1 hypothetical protein [Algoriphagus limi]